MLKTFLSFMISTAYAHEVPELIPCEDGTMADPTVGCIETPKAIVSSQSEILHIILKSADMVVSLVAAVSIGVLIYGGIIYALSLGNEGKVKKAKSILFWSIFGLVVSLLAKYIVAAILIIITK